MSFPKQSFVKILSGFSPTQARDPNVTALASFRTERFVPVNTATTFTLGNQPIPDQTRCYKNGLRMDDSAYSIAGKTVTLTVAANGTDVYLVDYYFRGSA